MSKDYVMNFNSFIVPRYIYFGWGSLEVLKYFDYFGFTKAAIIVDKACNERGQADLVASYLKEAGMEVVINDDVEADPSRQNILRGAAWLEKEKPDFIIGLGGGSAIDAGKGMWCKYEYPEKTWEELFVPGNGIPGSGGVPPLRKKARYCGIATTSGTACEMSLASVITNRDIHPNKKDFTLSYEITPDFAIADPQLCMSMPANVTANTGYDVLVHACEAYVSLGRSDLTNGMAIATTKQAYEWLPRAVANGDDKIAREKMHNASLMAGFTFTQTALGLCHSNAHAIGAEWHIPHGLANALCSIPAIQYNAPSVPERYADLARACGKDPKTALEGPILYIEAMKELKKAIGLPMSIKELGIDEKEFFDKIDGVAQNAMNDGSTPTNPRPATLEACKAILTAAYYGTDLKL